MPTLYTNPQAQRGLYPAELRALMNIASCRQSRAWLRSWPLLTPGPTPVWSLPGLARQLGVASLDLKDESCRSSLSSFKVLGAPIALIRLIVQRWPERAWTAESLFAGQHAAELAELVVISATDGNHGRALAAAAHSVGCRCVIVLHAQVSDEREQAIAAFGAQIVRIAGNYDDSVHEAARLAQAHGWQVVSDTSYDGYQTIPRDVMQGYSILADEVYGSWPDAPKELSQQPDEQPPEQSRYTHVLLQGGVGGLAAGFASYVCERFGADRPTLIVVEPEQADCLQQSAIHGRAARATGSVDSLMAGLACGETSPLAWQFLQPAINHFLTVSDSLAEAAMRLLADAPQGDLPIVSGESGAAGLAGLLALTADPLLRQQAGLDEHARVLLISTEGATAPSVYQAIVGRGAAAVLAAQQTMLQARHREQGITTDQLMARIDAHAQIGAIAGGGVARLALTDADRQGRDQLVTWMRELGLDVKIDAIGNLFGIRAGLEPAAAPVMTGSHIDTVATGGRYDGNYGVLAGLEVVRWLNDRQISTRRPLVVAAFTNEEGVRYQPDMMGSLVHAGGLPLQAALDTMGRDGTRLGDELARIGYAGDLPVGSLVPHTFLELHIEQGPVLDQRGLRIGAVQDLQGISWQQITITGQSNHSGTTPMAMRRDAGFCAARIAVFVRELAQRFGGAQVGTVGAIKLHPNLINVIAAQATLTVDLRHTDEHRLQQAEQELAGFLAHLAEQERVTITTEVLARFEPVQFDAGLVDLIENVASEQGLAALRMTSGAGHDAQMMARVCPSAMIFVPSRDGISHNPAEHTDAEDLAAGASVLLGVLRRLAG